MSAIQRDYKSKQGGSVCEGLEVYLCCSWSAMVHTLSRYASGGILVKSLGSR